MIASLFCKRSECVNGLKKCFACQAILPFSEFYKHPQMADGHLGKCKSCHREAITQNRIKNLERIRKYDRDRGKKPERKKAASLVSKKWRASDPRIMRCHNAVARALKSGKLQKLSCERCGAMKTLAHHESYDEPLTVMWLCQPCHKQRHKEIDRQKLYEKEPSP
jgi:hypothetical protein